MHGDSRARMRHTRTAALVVVGGLLLAACGGTSTGSDGTDSGDDIDLEAIEAAIEPWGTPPEDIAVTEPLAELPTGKTVVMIGPADPPCQQISDGLTEALGSLGVEFSSVLVGGTPEELQEATQQAADRAPDLVASCAIDINLIQDQLADIRAKGIPVVSWATPTPPPDTFAASFLSPTATRATASAVARYMILRSGGQARLLMVNQSILSFTEDYTAALRETLENECPECSYTEIDSLPNEIGSAIPGNVVSALQRDPSINWVTYAYGAMSLGVGEAMVAGGIGDRVKTVTQSPASNNSAAVKDGAEQGMFVLNYELFSYYVADGIARVLVGQEPPDLRDHVFSYLVEQDDLADIDVTSEVWNPLPGFQEQFEALWGVGA